MNYILNVLVYKARTKTLNQECGGAYGVLGRCRKGLRCTANEDEFLDGVSITGLCFHSGK